MEKQVVGNMIVTKLMATTLLAVAHANNINTAEPPMPQPMPIISPLRHHPYQYYQYSGTAPKMTITRLISIVSQPNKISIFLFYLQLFYIALLCCSGCMLFDFIVVLLSLFDVVC